MTDVVENNNNNKRNNSLCAGFLQSLCVFTLIFLILLTIFGVFLLLACCFSFYTCWIPIIYFIWYLCDLSASEKGGRRSDYFRTMKFWNYCRDYFSAQLIKTHDLEATKNYLMCVHPHGIIPFGSMLNFCTESTSFSQHYPGIQPHLLVMSQSPWLPIWREFLLLTGALSCSENSIKYVLTNQGENCKEKGQCPVLIVGGISEQYLTSPNQYKLYLNSRRGFVRVALETGTSLVPAFSFGENETYNTLSLDSCCIKSLESFFKFICCSMVRYRSPIFRGRCFTLMPFRKRLTMVIGKPIEINEKIDKPSNEQIDRIHDLYVNELINLYNEYKNKYLDDESNTNFLIV